MCGAEVPAAPTAVVGGWGGCFGGCSCGMGRVWRREDAAEARSVSAVDFHAAPQLSWFSPSTLLQSVFSCSRLMYHPKIELFLLVK